LADEAASGTVRNFPCVLFAYHELGYACLAELLRLGAPIAALFTHTDAPGEEIWWRSCADLARANAIPVHAPQRITEHEIEAVRELAPAIIYSFYYRNLLPDSLLRLATQGAYNLHGSLLPKYRGRAPINWMLVNGETEAGVTLHHMVARADAGDIVGQRAASITDDDTALTLYQKIVPLGAGLLRDLHPLIALGRAPRYPQDLSRGSYYGRRRPEDGRIDWSWPARRIFNLIRAVTHPYPGAFCSISSRKIFFWRAQIVAESGYFGPPGSILETDSEGSVRVAAGSGALRVIRVQFQGESEATGADALGKAAQDRLRLE
jgi:methionyl-tRNA formyltransferase